MANNFKGIASAKAFLSVSNDNANEEVVHDPSSTVVNIIKDMQYMTAGGTLKSYNSMEAQAPMSEQGGEGQISITREENRIHGTQQVAYSTNGTMTNPNIEQPSSSFYPNKSIIKNILSPLSSVVENPYMILGLIALSLEDADGDSHTVNYVNLPQKVTDNQEIKDELIGE